MICGAAVLTNETADQTSPAAMVHELYLVEAAAANHHDELKSAEPAGDTLYWIVNGDATTSAFVETGRDRRSIFISR